MRTIVLLPVAAAALAAGAIGAWGLGLASPRAVVPELSSSTAVCAPAATASPLIGQRAKESLVWPRAIRAASYRYRAETCSGDYVCGEEGAWELISQVAER
jgi:hypothetical protein